MEIKGEIEKIEKLIEERAEDKLSISSNTMKVNVKKITSQLGTIEKEIEKKYREAKNLWEKSIKLYTDFLKKNPGSQQLNPPQKMPERPKELEVVKGFINIFSSVVDSEIYVYTNLLKDVFLEATRGIYEARHQAYIMQTAVSGLAVGIKPNNWSPEVQG